jgi:hypothetical protein
MAQSTEEMACEGTKEGGGLTPASPGPEGDSSSESPAEAVKLRRLATESSRYRHT